jgi:16S rRNA (cytosine967-C5)-methyltransferase
LTPYFILISNVKLHRPLYHGIVTGLEYIFAGNFYADKVIERLFKVNKQWGSRDRALVAETIYDMVRHWRLLNELGQTGTLRFSPQHAELLIQLYFHFLKHTQVQYQFENKIKPADFDEHYQLLQKRSEVKNSVADWMNTM